MIWVHQYSLTEKRRGALLKVETETGVGFADLHPWPELGDPSLEDSLKGHGPLLERALCLAEIDAKYRGKGIPVDLSHTPKSHFFLTDFSQIDRAMEEGFSSVKMKISGFEPAIAEFSVRWRLDANGKLSQREFEQYQDFENIEFLEDPFVGEWKKGKIPLAFDRGPEPAHYDIRIVKPALHDWEKIPPTHPTVVTSYLGHPLGQVADAFVAAQLPSTIECGLLSHRVYPKNTFSERLPWKGPHFRHPGGTGFGYDDLLHKLDWRKI